MTKLRTMTRINKHDTTLETIMAYYMNPEGIKLTSKQEQIKDRWRFINECWLKADSTKTIINKCIAQFGVDERSVYFDIKNAKKLYGYINEADLKASRYIHYQYAVANYKKACLQRDLNAQRLAIVLMHDLCGGNDDQLTFNPDKLEVFDYIIKLPAKIEEFIKKHGSDGVMDFNQVSAEDAEYIEL